MKKILTAVAIALAIGGLSVAHAATTAPAGKAKYAIIFKNTGNPYGEKEMAGFKKAAEEVGADPFKFDAKNIAEWKTVY